MSFVEEMLSKKRPDSINSLVLPETGDYSPSPADWRDEVIYFLLIDRFSDGNESSRPMLDPTMQANYRSAEFRFDQWADSGSGRYQGGTIKGLISKLDYIANLGATTIWIAPIFKQRLHWDSYHGYAIQDFLEVDPRLGTRADLVEFVRQAHSKKLKVLLDIVFNHTGNNWTYANGQDQPPYLPFPQFYQKGQWHLRDGTYGPKITGDDDGVFPVEMQADDHYTRAGEGDLAHGNIDDPYCEFRRTDLFGNRDINYDGSTALDDVANCYKYWMALTDCDGFRIDTLKHVDPETGRNFCGAIKEYALSLGKENFFIVGEVAGSDADANRYLQVLGSNLSATLDIGEVRPTLTAVAKGYAAPNAYFDIVANWDDELGSHSLEGKRRVSVLDDHDHVCGPKIRFSADASPADHQVVAGVAIMLFTLGIPCIYYGTEQAFAGPESSARQFLKEYGTADRYLREAMFGPEHPRKSGINGVGQTDANFDDHMPGFGAFGTTGAHSFNPNSEAYIRIAALAKVRKCHSVLRYGRQYQRPISNFADPFNLPKAGEIIAWSRVLNDVEAVCVVNGNGAEYRGGDVLVDSTLHGSQVSPVEFEVIANSAQSSCVGQNYTGAHPIGEKVPVKMVNGTAYLEIRNIAPAETIILINRTN